MSEISDIPVESCVQDLFDAQVARSPESIALICEEERLTYSDLAGRVNQLACHLQQLGVKPETLVGVCMNRSLDMVIAILSILKAGGAYVPLDPSYPEERLSFILEDAQVKIVITQSELLGMFAKQEIKTICLDQDWEIIVSQPTEVIMKAVTPGNLAYVIYTSGSTGKPKGVMITHSSLFHFVHNAGSALDVTQNDVYLQTASIAYALSVRQLMIPLTYGATVVIASAAEVRDPLMLFELIKRQHVTLMDVVPSFWRSCIQRLSELPPSDAKDLLNNSLRRIVSIGEALSYELPHDWEICLSHKATLVNIFGQTETTGVVATYPIPRGSQRSSKLVPIGRSIADTKLYILDPQLKPVQEGEQGELCVSSPCLASGYLNRPDLTAQKFIANPFNDGLSTCLYRTGDMAQMREDGNIEFLGRGDYQVKIRGQRLELGEVETIIREHAAVKECVVTARGDQPDEKYLAAYIVLVAGQTLEISELRDFVGNRAPNFMIPSTFMFMDSIPLTPNGKIDRLALPDPLAVSSNKQTSRDLSKEPNNHIEHVIAGIWKDLMKLDYVGIHDNFFDLGGHSLTVVRLFSRLEQEFGIRLPAMTILRAPTIAELAEQLKNSQTASEPQALIPIQPRGKRSPFFCVHGVAGGLLGYRDLIMALGDDQPFYGLQAIGHESHQASDLSIEAMASRYIDAMRSFQPNGPYRIGGYCFGGVVAYEMACQLEKKGEHVSLLAIFEGFMRDSNNVYEPFSKRFGFLLKSIPHWIKDYVSLSPDDLRYRTRSTLRNVWIKVQRSPDLERRARVEAILETDLSRVPKRSVVLTQMHSKALRNYKPGKYGGTVTLFRARNRTINEVVFGSLDPKMGWGDFAEGGVNVILVDGFHRNIHLPPYVNSLAAELSYCLGMEG
jgi:amino acid adenylation domain-containing protein